MPRIESSLYAAIGDHSVDGPNAKIVNVRLPAALAAYIAELAEQNGRTVADEIRASLRVSVLLSRLNIVLDDELQARRRESSDGILGLSPETARTYAKDLREQLTAEWRQMLPAAHARYERAFPEFLWSAAPVDMTEFTVQIEQATGDIAAVATLIAEAGDVTVMGNGREIEFKVLAEDRGTAGHLAWERLGDLREQAGLPRHHDGQPRGFAYESERRRQG